MVVLTAETCWAMNEYWINNKISGIKLVFSLYATTLNLLCNDQSNCVLCFVGCVSWHSCVIKTNLMYYLSSVHFANKPLHVSGIFVAHHQAVYCIYTTRTSCCIYIYSIPPDYWLQICPKHVEVDWWNKQRINSASSWFLLRSSNCV